MLGEKKLEFTGEAEFRRKKMKISEIPTQNNLHTKLYLDRTMGKCSKPRSEVRGEGAEFKAGRGRGGGNTGGKMQKLQIPSHSNSTYQILF